MLVISNENSGCDVLFLISRNCRHDLNSMSRIDSLCLYYISVLRPRFDVPTSFLLSASLLLCRSFFFRLQHLSVVLSLQVGCDSTLLVFLFSCRDVVIKLRPSSFFNQCNSYRDLTVLFFSKIYVATSIPCHDIISVSIYVDLCCDHVFLTL